MLMLMLFLLVVWCGVACSCLNIYDPNESTAWQNAWLCIPTPLQNIYTISFSPSGPINGMDCISIKQTYVLRGFFRSGSFLRSWMASFIVHRFVVDRCLFCCWLQCGSELEQRQSLPLRWAQPAVRRSQLPDVLVRRARRHLRQPAHRAHHRRTCSALLYCSRLCAT